ncbi:uncharacterized protein LOC134612201 [Pelobates fuscus]|uniref:uncharacterized protein LOC134612201 n=1 Tax=Pelobates fuscus TaxID=191477 RepID=UPI002FE4CD0F
MVKENPFTTSSQEKNTLQVEVFSLSKSTIKRRLHKRKYRGFSKPFINLKNRKARLNFAPKHLKMPAQYWNRILWTVKTKINLYQNMGGSGVVRRRLGAVHDLKHTTSPLLSANVSNGILQTTRFITGGRLVYSQQSDDSSRPVSRYPIPNKKDLPHDIVKKMEEVEKEDGILPNIYKAMAHRPNEFRHFFAHYDCLMNKETGNLSRADKELLIVATSAYNKCPYCVTAHGAQHIIHSKNPILAYQVIINWGLAELNQRERAMVEFALAIAKPENITEIHFKQLEKHGLDREDAWDIAAITAFFAMANRLAYLMDLRPNDEFCMS